MLSAAVRRTSRDVSIMKEKLIFSGVQLHRQVETGSGLCSLHPAGSHGCVYTYFTCSMYRQAHGTDIRIPNWLHVTMTRKHTHTHTHTSQ